MGNRASAPSTVPPSSSVSSLAQSASVDVILPPRETTSAFINTILENGVVSDDKKLAQRYERLAELLAPFPAAEVPGLELYPLPSGILGRCPHLWPQKGTRLYCNWETPYPVRTNPDFNTHKVGNRLLCTQCAEKWCKMIYEDEFCKSRDFSLIT